MTNLQIESNEISLYCSNEKKRYDLWVYTECEVPKVFMVQTPNTQHIWFQFYTFSHLYWRIMESKCIDTIKGNNFYNFNSIKEFMLDYLLCGTNIPNILIQRKSDGTLTEKSSKSVNCIHPRILRALLDSIDIFPHKMTTKQEKELEKQCAILFGQGNSVSNPHEWIVIYCNLISFWEKFGLNYYDIMKLPNETYLMLKKIMGLENDHKSQAMSSSSNKNKGVKF